MRAFEKCVVVHWGVILFSIQICVRARQFEHYEKQKWWFFFSFMSIRSNFVFSMVHSVFFELFVCEKILLNSIDQKKSTVVSIPFSKHYCWSNCMNDCFHVRNLYFHSHTKSSRFILKVQFVNLFWCGNVLIFRFRGELQAWAIQPDLRSRVACRTKISNNNKVVNQIIQILGPAVFQTYQWLTMPQQVSFRIWFNSFFPNFRLTKKIYQKNGIMRFNRRPDGIQNQLNNSIILCITQWLVFLRFSFLFSSSAW